MIKSVMRFLSSMLIVSAIALASCSSVDSDGTSEDKLRVEDLTLLVGDWTGTLSYIDYTRQEPVAIPVTATIKRVSDNTLKYTISYPDKPWEDSVQTVTLSHDGRVFNGREIKAFSRDSDELRLSTSYRGEDDNQPADILMSYGFNGDELIISKDVRYLTSDHYINRNIYSYYRK